MHIRPTGILTKQVLTSGGHIHYKHYRVTGAGLREVVHVKDKLGRVHTVYKHRASSSHPNESNNSRPKMVSREHVKNSIAGCLSNMNISKF